MEVECNLFTIPENLKLIEQSKVPQFLFLSGPPVQKWAKDLKRQPHLT